MVVGVCKCSANEAWHPTARDPVSHCLAIPWDIRECHNYNCCHYCITMYTDMLVVMWCMVWGRHCVRLGSWIINILAVGTSSIPMGTYCHGYIWPWVQLWVCGHVFLIRRHLLLDHAQVIMFDIVLSI